MLGKFPVIMADPPWDIHMELPYGTMGDDEMRNMNVQVHAHIDAHACMDACCAACRSSDSDLTLTPTPTLTLTLP